MPTTIPTNPLDLGATLIVAKGAILIILLFYAIFALIIIRQVDLMGKTLISTLSPVVKAIAIINVGLSVGLIILAWGIL